MSKKMRRQFEEERWAKIEAARDLCYGAETIEALKHARTFPELERIMIDARHRM